MKQQWNNFLNATSVILFGLTLLMALVFVCEIAARLLFGLPMMWMPFILVAVIFVYGSLRHVANRKPPV
jgi:urea transporter